MLGNVVLHREHRLPVLAIMWLFSVTTMLIRSVIMPKINLTNTNTVYLAVEQALKFRELHSSQLHAVDAPDSVVHPHSTVTERRAAVGLYGQI